MSETRKHKVAVILAKYFLRAGRGRSLTARFTDIAKDALDGTVYIFAIKGLFGVVIEPKYLIGLIIGKTILEYVLGWLDQLYGFWLVECEYNSHDLNPFNKELMDRIKDIQKQIDLKST